MLQLEVEKCTADSMQLTIFTYSSFHNCGQKCSQSTSKYKNDLYRITESHQLKVYLQKIFLKMVIKHFIAVLCSLQQEYGGISYTSHIS